MLSLGVGTLLCALPAARHSIDSLFEYNLLWDKIRKGVTVIRDIPPKVAPHIFCRPALGQTSGKMLLGYKSPSVVEK